jgi:hypothetical protein
MDFNEYVVDVYVRSRLEEARAIAARQRAGSADPVIAPALRAAFDGVRSLYRRWSSAASAGSKPMTSRAWSRSR